MSKKKQLTFDLDTKVAKKILGDKNYTKAYADIRRFMKSEYNLCYEDLGYLVDYETKKNLKKQQEL